MVGPLSVLLLGACVAAPPSSRRSFRFDTETASRLRHATPVESTTRVLTTVAAGVTRSRLAPVLLGLLPGDEAVNELELRLVQCAREAERRIHQPLFGDRTPTREECGEEVDVDGCGQPITQAMALGRKKHALALECARSVLQRYWPKPFSIEQRYRFFRHARFIETLSAEEEKRLLSEGCTQKLWRTIKPDLVLHASDSPLRAVLVLDFKFPCPETNSPRWTRYGRDSAYPGATQGEIYREALRAEALLVSPQGITP